VISPLLANIYLHYVYDLWVEARRQRRSTGDMIVVRYADDTIVGFQCQSDAERFPSDLKDRLATGGCTQPSAISARFSSRSDTPVRLSISRSDLVPFRGALQSGSKLDTD
jgi:hypothetical protein